MRPLKTLDRALSKAGLGSRTEARSWIGAGRVSVNGRVIQTPDHWVDIERDRVTLDGKPVRGGEKIYIVLYKPKGYITTYNDPEGRPTVYDLIQDAGAWVSPVGRLDLETSGLLILTNDTQFAERLFQHQAAAVGVGQNHGVRDAAAEFRRRPGVNAPGLQIRGGVRGIQFEARSHHAAHFLPLYPRRSGKPD